MSSLYSVEWKLKRGSSWRWWSAEKSLVKACHEVAFIKDNHEPYSWRITRWVKAPSMAPARLPGWTRK
jgi:hypothetical protein